MDETTAREIAEQAAAGQARRGVPVEAVQGLEEVTRRWIRQELRTVMAAALADPGVNPTAKSLAGYALEYLSRPGHELDADRATLQAKG